MCIRNQDKSILMSRACPVVHGLGPVSVNMGSHKLLLLFIHQSKIVGIYMGKILGRFCVGDSTRAD